MKIAGAVILYYPDENITRHILSYIHVLDKLYVADNSENKNNALFEQIIKIKNVVYLHDGENKGIASRLNQAAKLAIEEGCEWLLTMDQDSYFEKNTVDAYLNC
ncbi:MAG TPA: glycosyltransferase, partial [Panacibacter sp.]|nr:glycosyltransferase [Panacibacter sp.]